MSEFALSQLSTPATQAGVVVGRATGLAAQGTALQTAPGTLGTTPELEQIRRTIAALQARAAELESHDSGDLERMPPPPAPAVAVQAPGARSPVLASSIASSAQTQQVEMLQREKVAQDARIAALEYENQRLREQRTPLTQDQGPAAAVQGPISPLQQPDFGVGLHQVRFCCTTLVAPLSYSPAALVSNHRLATHFQQLTLLRHCRSCRASHWTR